MNTKNMVLIGQFCVDSGQAMVGDPCYLDDWEPWNGNAEPFDNHKTKAGQYGYLGACGLTLNEGYGTLGNGSGVVFSTGYGDGVYPVYADINEDGRIVKVTIVFEEDEE
jgi:hypothetical protein